VPPLGQKNSARGREKKGKRRLSLLCDGEGGRKEGGSFVYLATERRGRPLMGFLLRRKNLSAARRNREGRTKREGDHRSFPEKKREGSSTWRSRSISTITGEEGLGEKRGKLQSEWLSTSSLAREPGGGGKGLGAASRVGV